MMRIRTTKDSMTTIRALACACVVAGCVVFGQVDMTGSMATDLLSYPIVDTGQTATYDNSIEISPAAPDEPFYGQDAQHDGLQPSYVDNGDGTITDLVTGLMWQQSVGEKMTFEEARNGTAAFALASYDDWRLPTIKELYSLIDFTGLDTGPESNSGARPFINTAFFDFQYGDTSAGERIIDAQWVSSTEYAGDALVFGVNFADGRIKGYGFTLPGRGEKTFFVRYVRGNPDYGVNDFVDNSDSTISDRATGLMWLRDDYPVGLDWETALAYVQGLNMERYLGYEDWRLPNAKELQSIVDYTRAPSATDSPAIDPAFHCTSVSDENGQWNWGYYWTSTTHASARGGENAVYIAFGEALGFMHNEWIDIHGAGAQRSDPKQGVTADYPVGRGPQGDAVHIYNFVRAVRTIN